MNNRCTAVLTILIGSLALATLAAKAAGPPISITIKAVQDSVKSGSGVAVKVTVKNVSDHTVPEFLRAFSGYIVVLADSNGKVVKENERMKNSVRSEAGIYITLEPQEKFEEELRISDEADMKAPGKYLIRVLRRIPKDQGGGAVASNVIPITVEEAPK